MAKKYASLETLRTFLDNIKTRYSLIGHKHTLSDITDYKVDSALSSTSTNPVQNKVLDAEFDAIAESMNALDLAIDGKANSSHTHTIANVTNLQSSLDAKVPTSRTVNGKVLSSNITLSASDVSAYSKSEIDSKLSTVNTSITNITSGSTPVKEAEHAESADTATNATNANHATSADSATSATSATKATQDGNGKVISSTYETKSDATAKLTEAKTYADNAATKVKNDLLNGAGTAYDTLKELGDLIDDNVDAISALETVAAGKANATHSHAISDVTNLQSTLDGKAAKSHGTHVSYSTTAPVMDGTASVGSASTVARSDHKHPTDTSRASKTEFDTHVADTTKHITSTERTNWNAAKTHADSAHAPSNAEKNQNAFSNVKVGTTTIAADTTTDTLELVGSNVTITPDATNDKVTIAVADGSTSTKGIVQLTNSTSSTSTTTAATPNSVKSAYDLANTAKTNAATAQTRADSAYSLAESKVDSLSDLGITATATELNYIDGVTSNVQTQLDNKAALSHNHSASNITSGTMNASRLPVASKTASGIVSTSAQTFAGAKTFEDSVTTTDLLTANGGINVASYLSPTTTASVNLGGGGAAFNGVYAKDYNLYGTSSAAAGGKFYIETQGTTTTEGKTILNIGNSLATGKGGNATGQINVYNKLGNAVYLRTPENSDYSYYVTLPEQMGTLITDGQLEWEQIYDSGAITEPVNAFANIDISGYKKLRVVVKCVNDGSNSTSKNGAVTFTATNGTTYQFPCWTTMFTNADYTSGNMATFEINDGWLVCSGASRMLKTSNFLGTEGGTADNLPSTGSGIMRCTSKLSKMMISALDQDTNYYLLAGSRVIVWGSVI